MSDQKGSLRIRLFRKGSKSKKKSKDSSNTAQEVETVTHGLTEMNTGSLKSSKSGRQVPNVYNMVKRWNVANGHEPEANGYPLRKSSAPSPSSISSAFPSGTWSSSSIRRGSTPAPSHSFRNIASADLWAGSMAPTGSRSTRNVPSNGSWTSNNAMPPTGSWTSKTVSQSASMSNSNSAQHPWMNFDGNATWSNHGSSKTKVHAWARPERKVSETNVSGVEEKKHNPFRAIFSPQTIPDTVSNNNVGEPPSRVSQKPSKTVSVDGSGHIGSHIDSSNGRVEVGSVLGDVKDYLGTLSRQMKARRSIDSGDSRDKVDGEARYRVINQQRKGSIFDNVENENSGQHHSPPSPATVQQLKHQLSQDSHFMSPRQNSPAPSVYTGMSRGGSMQSLSFESAEYIQHTPKFVKDTSKFWYKPNITREDAIVLLKDKSAGTFVIRDSNSFPGAFGLALKVSQLPPNVQSKAADPTTDLVRHFLIESTTKGVRLKGCSNEPIFGSLAALVYQHSITPLALPCKLVLPELDSNRSEDSPKSELPSSAAALLAQGAACNVLFINSVDMESLTGPQAISRAMNETEKTDTKTTQVHFKVSSQGITLTDNQRKLFFRRHYAVTTVTYCGMDPEDRRWVYKDESGIERSAKVFGFVAKKQGSQENVCHIFAELDPDQPASAIVNFVTKVMIGTKSKS